MALLQFSNLKSQFLFIGALVFFSLYIFYNLYSGAKQPSVILDESEIGIRGGEYNVKINYVNITKVDTINILPEIHSRTNGFSAFGILKGHFKMEGIVDAMLFVDVDKNPFIVIEAKNEVPIFINFKEKEKTLNLFNALLTKLK